MDRSFNSSLLGNRSPFSPRSRTAISKRAVTPAAFRKSSRFSVSARSTQSVQIVLKSQSNCVERFGQPLPVLITEALTFVDRNTIVSARISSECGYAWLVCGRRLLIWQYRQSPVSMQTGTPRRAALANQCFELQLPQSDLAHRAELVSVFQAGGAGAVPSCLAVSPEGVIRYWPAIAHEGVSVEQSIDLQGQECDSLTGIEGLGCILATTTCTVVLVQPYTSSGRHSLICHTLKMPSGWLGGISKRMSSLIFGPINSDQAAETRLVRILSIQASSDIWHVYVLAGHSIQRWHIPNNASEQFVYASDLTRLVRDGFQNTVWENSNTDQADMDTWILDLQEDSENVTFLAAALNMHASPQVHYALMTVETNGHLPPNQFLNFQVLKINNLYREDNSTDYLNYRFLISGASAYIYNHRSITVVRPQEEPDTLEFNTPQDFLLGGSICVNTPVFFSRNHGLVAVTNSDQVADLNVSLTGPSTPVETSFVETENLSLYNFNPEEMYAAYKDINGQLKSAFIFHLKNQFGPCNDILQELFLSEGSCIPGVDTVLDKAVVDANQQIMDDVPANDPRWIGQTQLGLGSSYSMQILQQLKDKGKAQKIFLKFLKDTFLWKNLAAVTMRDTATATAHVLAESMEKITAAIALKSTQTSQVLQKAIGRATADSDTELTNGLTAQDVFFREVTHVHKAIVEMVNICEDAAHSDMKPLEVSDLIYESNLIILNVLKEVMTLRKMNRDEFQPSETALALAQEYLPWTSASGEQGLMDSLLTMQDLTFSYGAKVTSDNNLLSELYEQLITLKDFILDGRKSHLESIKGTAQEGVLLKQYESDRRRIIAPLIKEAQWEGAALLAEKYLDFESLVLICEKTNNQARMDEYMDRFSGEGFSQFVYAWYLQENKQGKLIERCKQLGTNERNKQELRQFLAQHPSLAWIQNAYDRNFDGAAETLKQLAEIETESVTRQKTMLSMAKLAKLAGNENREFIETVNGGLELIGFQEDIPDYVLHHFGFDTNRPKVISPKDLIHLYICPEYKDASEVEFKKALDLLIFIDNYDLRDELNLKIWRSMIMRNNWDERSLDSPLDVLQNKLMFKTIDLALMLGADPKSLLPPLDTLLEGADLLDLQDNRNFQYLIKMGYEHVSSLFVDS